MKVEIENTVAKVEIEYRMNNGGIQCEVVEVPLCEFNTEDELIGYVSNQSSQFTCLNCEGHGTYEELASCGKVASMCCGGCTETHECEDCNGSGVVDMDEFELG